MNPKGRFVPSHDDPVDAAGIICINNQIFAKFPHHLINKSALNMLNSFRKPLMFQGHLDDSNNSGQVFTAFKIWDGMDTRGEDNAYVYTVYMPSRGESWVTFIPRRDVL